MKHAAHIPINGFVAKENAKLHLSRILILLLPVLYLIFFKWDSFITRSHNEKIIIGVFLLLYLLFFGFKAMDRRSKLIVAEDGFWTMKTQLLKWETIWYFHLAEENSKGGKSIFLLVKLKDETTEFKIHISEFDKPVTHIIAAMEKFSAPHAVINLGSAISKF